MGAASFTRSTISFRSGDAECAAWYFRPDPERAGTRAPVVVLGHGLGATRELGLETYAARFTEDKMLDAYAQFYQRALAAGPA